MPLVASALAVRVFATHLAAFPLALDAVRSNQDTGVPAHNVPEALIGALCSGFVTSMGRITLQDIGGGTNDVPGAAPPTPFFPDVTGAVQIFLDEQGWVGANAAIAAGVLIGSVLSHFAETAFIQMDSNLLMGTGTGNISRVSQPDLEGQLVQLLQTDLYNALKATGRFGQDDDPAGEVNAHLAAQIPNYARAYARGIGRMTAVIAYVGLSSGAPVVGAANTGRFV